jgi:hypothetical protein
VPHERVNGSPKHAVLTVFPEEKLKTDKPLQTQREETSPSGHELDNPPSNKSTRNNRSRLVKAAQEVATALKRRRVVKPKYDFEKEKPSLVSTEPAAPIQGIFTARQFREQGQ